VGSINHLESGAGIEPAVLDYDSEVTVTIHHFFKGILGTVFI